MIILYSLITLSLIIVIGFYSRYIYYKGNINKLICDKNKLELVSKLLPWIHDHLSSAINTVLDKYRLLVMNDKMSKIITVDQYYEIIEAIRIQFYGTIPKGFNQEVLFQYIDSKQIDIMIMSYFKNLNDIFKIKSE